MTAKPSSNDKDSSFGSTPSARSADEIRETVKEKVGKGVAAVAGVADGINEQMEETDLKETAEQAVRQVGETASGVVRAAREETDNIRSAFKGEPAEEPATSSGLLEEPSSTSTLTSSLYDGTASTSFGTPVEEEE